MGRSAARKQSQKPSSPCLVQDPMIHSDKASKSFVLGCLNGILLQDNTNRARRCGSLGLSQFIAMPVSIFGTFHALSCFEKTAQAKYRLWLLFSFSCKLTKFRCRLSCIYIYRRRRLQHYFSPIYALAFLQMAPLIIPDTKVCIFIHKRPAKWGKNKSSVIGRQKAGVTRMRWQIPLFVAP